MSMYLNGVNLSFGQKGESGKTAYTYAQEQGFSGSEEEFGTALASGVICIAPVFVMYLFAQRYIIEGMASAGIKG